VSCLSEKHPEAVTKIRGEPMTLISSSKEIKNRLCSMFDDLLDHNGYGQIQVDMRLLRRGQKEIILRCGKEYRFVVEFSG
jgi:hypothetical protein